MLNCYFMPLDTGVNVIVILSKFFNVKILKTKFLENLDVR